MSSEINVLMEMGFSKVKAEQALSVTGNRGVEQAMEWLLAHSEELDITDSIPANQNKTPVENNINETQMNASENAVPVETSNCTSSNENKTDDVQLQEQNSAEQVQSIKCLDCGKMFKSESEVEFHAVKSGHQNFSESTEEIKPLTEEEKLEQRRKLEERIRERRQVRLENERQEAIEQEKNRRKTGQEIAMARKKQEEEEMKRIAEQKRREKMEDRLARQRVLEAIEADKQARREKFGGGGGGVAAAAAQENCKEPASTPPLQPSSSPQPAGDYDQCKLQIRLTDGKTLTQSFGTNEELAAVRLYVQLNRTDSPEGSSSQFSLMTSFPRKVFSEEDMAKPLSSLGLVPSAVLIVTKSQ